MFYSNKETDEADEHFEINVKVFSEAGKLDSSEYLALQFS